MCGITGIISSRFSDSDCQGIVQKTLNEIKHRGPDHRGVFFEQIKSWNIGFGMNRLSVIDLAPSGNQPMHLGHLSMVYNGEIYNYLEIKEELKQKGHKFVGTSDAEVVLHAFFEWGLDCISRFIGMFAIALFDRLEKKCYLIRDRVGEKPLYYYHQGNNFIFCSELKGLLVLNFIKKDINNNKLFSYLAFNSVSPPYTLFEDMRQLSPGEVLSVSFNREKVEISSFRYWEFPELLPDYSLTEERVTSDLESLIHDAVKIRLRSDVPVGIFLSGGIDSSLVAAFASEISPHINTFTIGYKDSKYNESDYADFVARHINVEHRTIDLDEKKADINFDNLAYISDDCTANFSFIPYNILAKKTRECVKVALSGDGADEFFCGYSRSYGIIAKLFRYRHILKIMFRAFPFNKKIRILNRILSDVSGINTLVGQFIIRDKLSEVEALIKGEFSNHDFFRRINIEEKLSNNKKVSFWQLNFYEGGGNYLTDTVLKTTDRASMAHSLEVRSVFTDHRIIEYMARVPEKIILKRGINKFLLRKILSKRLPKKFVFKRIKKGFSVPLQSDYKDSWQRAIDSAKGVLLNKTSSLIRASQMKNILEDKKEKYNIEFKSRLVFLAHFIKKWNLNYA